MKPFSVEFLEAFHRSKGILWGVGGTAVSALAFYANPDTTVSIKWLIPIGLLVGLLVHCLFDLALHCHSQARKARPKVIQGIEKKGDQCPYVLLQPHADFYFEQFVSFYVMDDQFEVVAGVGYVANIQDNKLILVRVLRESAGHKKLWNEVRENNAKTLGSLVVRPAAPKSFIDELLSEQSL